MLDRAGGEGGEDVNDTDEEVREEEVQETQDYYVPTGNWNPETGFEANDIDPPQMSNFNVDPMANSSSVPRGTTSTTRKRKHVDTVAEDRLVEMVGTFCQDANARIGTLMRALEAEFGDPDNRSRVCDATAEVDGIDENDQLVIVQRLHNNPKDMELFFRLPLDKRGRLVKLMLEGRF
ncbi:hypothetical protein Salat_2573400 [Sesamum alatum]|uniref:Uncharacterized protein n=1 Tax=Sesamum alatum TaxID=300844 RepID=A0AAE1XTS7_9LAMI|nr:hypothetical protein Salat_2573400 [Sesamum alatum]